MAYFSNTRSLVAGLAFVTLASPYPVFADGFFARAEDLGPWQAWTTGGYGHSGIFLRQRTATLCDNG